MEIKLKSKVLDKWAGILLDHSLKGITAKDVVMIKAEAVAWPLVSALQTRILKAGALADVFLVPPDNDRGRVWGRTVARFAKPSRIAGLPLWQKLRYENITKYIEIYGMEKPELTRNVSGPAMDGIMRLEHRVRAIWGLKPFVITMFPVPSFAKMERMPFPRYKKIICDAVTMAPATFAPLAGKLAAAVQSAKTIRIQSRDSRTGKILELAMSIEKSRILRDTDSEQSSLPCGEVYTSPDASSVEGEIFCDLPYSKQGDVLRGIYLKFHAGRVTDFGAREGGKFLEQIISTDPGAGRLGEVAFGLNPAINKPLMHPLFSEKLAATMHIALGDGFPAAHIKRPESVQGRVRYRALVKSGVANVSAQHVDMVVSFRKRGAGKAVFLDDRELKLKNGNWDLE